MTPNGSTPRYRTPEGNVYVTVAREPIRVIVSCGKHGTSAQVFADRLGAVCGLALRGGVSPQNLVSELLETRHDRSPRERGMNGQTALSIPDAIGLALEKELLNG